MTKPTLAPRPGASRVPSPLPGPVTGRPAGGPRPPSPAPNPLPASAARPARLPHPGGVASKAIIRRERDGEETVIEQTLDRIPSEPQGSGQGIVGVSQGLTIPGPKGSYMAARVDVAVYLPCANSVEDAQRVLGVCKELGDSYLDALSSEVTDFFSRLFGCKVVPLPQVPRGRRRRGKGPKGAEYSTSEARRAKRANRIFTPSASCTRRSRAPLFQ